MKGTRWVIIDTETDGLYEPIADNKVTTAEVMFLNSWLQDVGFIAESTNRGATKTARFPPTR